MSIKQIVSQHQSFGNLLSIFVKTRKDKPSERKFVTVHSVNEDFFIGKREKDERANDVIYYSDITNMKLDYNFHSLVGKNVKFYRLIDGTGNNTPTPSVVMGRVDYIRSEFKDDKLFDYLLFSGGAKIMVHEIVKTPEIIESVPKPVEPKGDSGNLLSGKSFELTTWLNEKVTLTFDKKMGNEVFLKMFENDYIKFEKGYNHRMSKVSKVNLDEYIDKIVKISYVKKDGNVNKLPFYFTGLLEIRNGNKVYMSNTYVCEKEDVCFVEHPIDSSQSFNIEKLKKISQNSDVIIWIQYPQSEQGISIRAVFDRLLKLNTKFGEYYISILIEKDTLKIKENGRQDIEITLFNGKKIRCWYCGTYEVGNRRYISVLINANSVLDNTVEGIREEFKNFKIRQDTLFIDEPLDAFENEDGVIDILSKIDFEGFKNKYVCVEKFDGEKVEGSLDINSDKDGVIGLTNTGYDWKIIKKVDVKTIEKLMIHEEIQKHIKNKSPIIFKYFDMLTYIIIPTDLCLDQNGEKYIMIGKKIDEKFEVKKMELIKNDLDKYINKNVKLQYLQRTNNGFEKTIVTGLLTYKNGGLYIDGKYIGIKADVISCEVDICSGKYEYLVTKYVKLEKIDGKKMEGYFSIQNNGEYCLTLGEYSWKNINPDEVKSIEEYSRDEGIIQMATDLSNLLLAKYFIPQEYIDQLQQISEKKVESKQMDIIYEKIKDHIIKTLTKTNKIKTNKFAALFVSKFLEIYLEYAKKHMVSNVDDVQKILVKVDQMCPLSFNVYTLKKWKGLMVNTRYRVLYRQKEKEISFISFYMKEDKEYVVVIDHSDDNKTKTFFTEYITFK